MKTTLLSLMIFFSFQAMANGPLFNYEKARQVLQLNSDLWISDTGVTSIGITSCIAGLPASLHGTSAPDVLPEACIQITFATDEALNDWVAQNDGRQSFHFDDVLIFLGPVENFEPQPGIAIHN